MSRRYAYTRDHWWGPLRAVAPDDEPGPPFVDGASRRCRPAPLPHGPQPPSPTGGEWVSALVVVGLALLGLAAALREVLAR